jgi:hypothetical protein
MSKQIPNPTKSEMSWAEYQEYVGDYFQKQLDGDPEYLRCLFRRVVNDSKIRESLSGLKWKRRTSEKPKWEGASGCCHQIDESFSTEDESAILLIECKHYGQNSKGEARLVDVKDFSRFLVAVIDISMKRQGSVVLSIVTTTQGIQGKSGKEEDCIAKLRSYFSEIGYPIQEFLVPDSLMDTPSPDAQILFAELVEKLKERKSSSTQD